RWGEEQERQREHRILHYFGVFGLSAVSRSYTTAVVSECATASRFPDCSNARWWPRAGRTRRPRSFPVAASHTRTAYCRSSLDTISATRNPSGENTTSPDHEPGEVVRQTAFCVVRSQTAVWCSAALEWRVLPSGSRVSIGLPRPPAANRLPSGERASEITPFGSSSNFIRSLPVSTSNTWTVLYRQKANVVPSALMSAARNPIIVSSRDRSSSSWASVTPSGRVRCSARSLPLRTSHTRRYRSSPQATRRLLSGVNRTFRLPPISPLPSSRNRSAPVFPSQIRWSLL